MDINVKECFKSATETLKEIEETINNNLRSKHINESPYPFGIDVNHMMYEAPSIDFERHENDFYTIEWNLLPKEEV